MRSILLSLTFLTAFSASAQVSDCTALSSISWMEGVWEAEDAVRRTVEEWTTTSAQTMEGEGRVYRKDSGAQVGTESLRLVEMDSDLFYLAKTPGNALPIAFRLVACAKESATFENADHDFPQRLVYRLVASDSLRVDVSDMDGNGFRLEFVRGAN